MIEGVSGVTAIELNVELEKKLQLQNKKLGAKLRNISVFLSLFTVALPDFSALDEAAKAIAFAFVYFPRRLDTPV